VRRLGQRTGELHRALGAAVGHPDLAPQPYSRFYQRSTYQSLRGLTCSVVDTLREQLSRLPAALRGNAKRIIAAEDQLIERFKTLTASRLRATRIACHGNYHLRQVLLTGDDDFTILDFEGEPPRPLYERRLKRSPLVDIASMVRSFHYAARVAMPDQDSTNPTRAARGIRAWSLFWRQWVSVAFLQAYFASVDRALLPPQREELSLLFEVALLERTLYELGHELTHRPDWVRIPLRDVRDFLDSL
jgi:maltose alpha-D-glucosyltransferase / alpha-amylase